MSLGRGDSPSNADSTADRLAKCPFRAQTGALPAAPRGAGLDEKKPFTGKGSVWLEEAKGFEPLMEF